MADALGIGVILLFLVVLLLPSALERKHASVIVRKGFTCPSCQSSITERPRPSLLGVLRSECSVCDAKLTHSLSTGSRVTYGFVGVLSLALVFTPGGAPLAGVLLLATLAALVTGVRTSQVWVSASSYAGGYGWAVFCGAVAGGFVWAAFTASALVDGIVAAILSLLFLVCAAALLRKVYWGYILLMLLHIPLALAFAARQGIDVSTPYGQGALVGAPVGALVGLWASTWFSFRHLKKLMKRSLM